MAFTREARRISRRLPGGWDRRVRDLGKALLDYRGGRGSLLRAPVYSFLARHSGLLLAPFGRGAMLVDAADKEIGRVVYLTGGYERIYMESALRVLSSRGRDQTGKTFVDVGANIGTSTLDALMHFGFERAVCFEPDDHNLRLLRMNLILNGLEDRASVVAAALTDHDGVAFLERSASNFGDHRLVDGSPAGSHAVACRQLDSLVAEGAVPVDDLGLVWIDVQGHEPSVLSGAGAVLEAGVPVVIEYSPAPLRETGGLDRLEKLISSFYETVVDLRLVAHGVTTGAMLPAADVTELRDRYEAWDHVDLLLLP
jgi:FkbM family methyltransferase